MRRLSHNGTWVVVLVGLIAAWQAYVRLRGVPQYVLPAPTDVARALWDERSPLASAAGVTAREMLAGVRGGARGRVRRGGRTARVGATPCDGPSIRCWSRPRACRSSRSRRCS